MWKDYFSFTRKEQYGILALMILILLLIAFRLITPLLLTPFDPSNMVEDVTNIIYLDDVKLSVTDNSFDIEVFNPNTVSHNQLVLFGINDRVVNNWQKFLKNGGRFSTAEDVKKIYGLSDSLYLKLKPFMEFDKIEQGEFSKEFNHQDKVIQIDLNRVDTAFLSSLGWSLPLMDSIFTYNRSHWFPKKIELSYLRSWNIDSFMVLRPTLLVKKNHMSRVYPDVGINSADTSLWSVLPGIGPVISRRIVDYKNRLGGFVFKDQLMEVYGFSPVLYEEIKGYIKVDSIAIRKININSASVHQMRNHPYMDFYKAKAIFDVRMANGKFTTIEEVKNLKDFEGEDWERIKFYLSISDH
ncbi:MAG TPA: helix-hairpin-helix domain-containing protein [Marinilabiliaceae bacterium]|nr:helix-hairpin-helix domain-containing protein [Marinilabiliaceae bacterium]